MKSETPRTDAAQMPDHAMREMVVSAGIARELERELNECREKNLWQCNEILKMKKIMAAMPNVES
jgi:hypothetical protein